MKLFGQIIDFFKLTQAEKEIAHHDIRQENMLRIFYMSMVVIPLSLIHIIVFWLKLDSATGIEHQWRVAIILCHVAIVSTFLVVDILLYFFSYRTKKNNKMALVAIYLIMFFLLFIGAVVASADQMITSAITPYLLTCIVAGLIILIRPLYALLLFGVSFIFFYFAISFVQVNQDIIISNRVNGFTILGVGLFLSFTLWKAKLTAIIQKGAMVKAAARLAFATKAGGVGIWDYNIASNNLSWDEQMFYLYGITPDAYNTAFEARQAMVHPDDLVKSNAEIIKAIKGEKEFDTEFRVLWPDGSVHNIRALATVQADDKGKPLYMIGTNWDITEQKKAEAALIKAKAGAETANKSKSTFLANMSHEIRTPLNAIIGFSQLLNREKVLTNSQKEYVVSINRAGEHLLKLINDILELSKIEAGRVEINPCHFDLHALLKDMQMMFKLRAQSKHLQLIIEIADDLPKYVFADDNKLRQIIINLISNAIKFTVHGGVAVRTKVDKSNDDISRLIVEIEDSGPGIPENEMERLFKHFEQTSSGIKTSSGTGLGLALSRELALLMGGNIAVKSTVDKGSVFTIDVIIKKGKTEDVEVVNTKRVVCIQNPQHEYRVLVVDDKEENRQVVANFLQLVGFQTNEAINGQDAISKFEQWNPHLILMDKRMPVLDGYEATRRIKATEKGRKTPIIIVTASSLEEQNEESTAPDIQGYIRKPFRENELFAAIGKALGIEYNYEEELDVPSPKYLNDAGAIVEDISKLPTNLVFQMLEAIEVADFHLLIQLIETIENNNSELAHYLMSKANNYDYGYLQEVLISKTSKI